MMQDDIDWTEDERRALDSFGADEAPSDMLRSRTLTALREQGHVGTARRRRRMAPSVIGIAAAATIIVGATAYFAMRSRGATDPGQQLVDSVTAPATGKTRVERHIIWF
jgi:hypothetical protein